MNIDSLNWLHHIYATDLTSKAKLTAAVVVSFMYQDNEEAFPGLGRLSHETSLGKRTVQRAIDELIEAGWLAKKSGGKAANGSLSQNRYQRRWPTALPRLNGSESSITLPSSSATLTPPIVTETIPMVTASTPIVMETIPMVAETIGVVSPWPTKEKVKKESKKKDKREGGEAKKRFTPPTRQEVEDYMLTKGASFAQAASWSEDFVEFYACKGWMVGKNKMQSWPMAASRWTKKNLEECKKQPAAHKQTIEDQVNDTNW